MKKESRTILTDNDDDFYSTISLAFKLSIGEDEEKFGIEEYSVDIIKHLISDDDLLIGKLNAVKFLRQIVGDMYSALDYHSATAPFLMLFDDGGDFINEVQEKAEVEGYFEDFLVLDRLEILPQYRGYGYTERIFEIIGRTIGYNSIAAIKAFPLQLEKGNKEVGFYGVEWQQQMQLDELPQNARNATRSLTNYYKKLGFKKLKTASKENFLIRSFSHY